MRTHGAAPRMSWASGTPTYRRQFVRNDSPEGVLLVDPDELYA